MNIFLILDDALRVGCSAERRDRRGDRRADEPSRDADHGFLSLDVSPEGQVTAHCDRERWQPFRPAVRSTGHRRRHTSHRIGRR